MNKLFYLLLACTLCLTSCGDDDSQDPVITTDDDGMNPDDSVDQLNMARDETVGILTNDGAEKVWRISQATLNNDNGNFDISTNFNVVDDEFVFAGTRDAGTLEWRPGDAINEGATDTNDALLDFYQVPVSGSYSFNAESSSELTGLGGNITFTVIDNNTITGTLSVGTTRSAANETLNLTLTQKTAADYASPPSGGLTFSLDTTFEAYSSFGQQHNVGFIGSNVDNSMYIAYRNDANSAGRSRILKYDLDTSTFIERNDTWNDFFTRKLDIINNELVLTGGQNIYTYDLDLTSEPDIVPHNAGNLSRFSTSTQGDNIYVVGGDLDEVADKLRKVNRNTGALDIVATMPAPKVHAGSAIVNNKLYIFGGRGAFFENTTVTTESFIYDLGASSFTDFNLPVALNNSYASRKENLIYIVGDIQLDNDGDGGVDDYNIWTGVYNTLDGTITELTHNLDDSDQYSFVHAMTVFNNKMYVIYGSILADPNGADSTWQILSTDLN